MWGIICFSRKATTSTIKNKVTTAIDTTTAKNEQPVQNENAGLPTVAWIGIGAAVLVAVGAVIVVLILKKKKV